MDRPVRWVAKLADVEEASMVGLADFAYWAGHLRDADLVPAEREGKAELLIVAGAGKFAGIKFRELSFSVLVSQPELQRGRNAAYLVQAINSCRFFALSERVLFSTPYIHGDVRLAGSVPAAIELSYDGRVVFRMQMPTGSSAGRQPSSCGEDGWDGAVFLPERQPSGSRKRFFARINGYTKRYPFMRDVDLVKIEPSSEIPVLQALVDSHFVPTEWVLRERATHMKSKTYKDR